MLVLLWVAALWKFVSALLTLPPLAHRLDFVCFYDSALAFRQGLDPYTTNLAAVGNQDLAEHLARIVAGGGPWDRSLTCPGEPLLEL